MLDSYLVDEKVDELAQKLEQTIVSPEDRPGFYEALRDSMDACGADHPAFVRRLIRRLERSKTLRPQRMEYLTQELLRQL